MLVAVLIYGVTINEAPRRFSSSVARPTPDDGFRTSKVVGKKRVAKQQFQLDVLPNNFEAGPGPGRLAHHLSPCASGARDEFANE